MEKISYTFLIKNYDEAFNKCKSINEPMLLTRKGYDSLIVMTKECFEKQQSIISLKEKLVEIEIEQQNGAPSYSVEELKEALAKIVEG